MTTTDPWEMLNIQDAQIDKLRAEVEALTEARNAAWEQCGTYKAQIGYLHDEVEALTHDNFRLLGLLAEANDAMFDEHEALRAENEALRYLLNGIASPDNIEAAIKYTQAAISPRRGES